MSEFLKKLYNEYLEEVVKPLSEVEIDTLDKQYDDSWNRGTFRFFHDKGVEFFEKAGLDESEYEIRCRSGFMKSFDRELWQEYVEAYGSKARDLFPGEYLVDLCWRRWDDDWYRTELALEVEWNPTPPNFNPGPPAGVEILDEDLHKLIDIRAPFKVAILACSFKGKKILRTEQIHDVLSLFSGWLKKGRYPGESYLLVFEDNYGKGGVEGHVISGDGDSEPLERYEYPQ